MSSISFAHDLLADSLTNALSTTVSAPAAVMTETATLERRTYLHVLVQSIIYDERGEQQTRLRRNENGGATRTRAKPPGLRRLEGESGDRVLETVDFGTSSCRMTARAQ